jgi:NAD+ synthase (glutamine-hydrolysing)
MFEHGFLRTAAAVPFLQLADCSFNGERTISLLDDAEQMGVGVVIFPEMGLTGYTCNDLFFQRTLQKGAIQALERVTEATAMRYNGIAVVGLPIVIDDQIFNCAAILQGGKVLGIVPKSYLPTYKEFYDARFFAPAASAYSRTVRLIDQEVPFGTDLLFYSTQYDAFVLGIEICEDLWVPVPPSCIQAYHGATVLANLSASNETIGKAGYRRQLVSNQSARCIAAYIYSGAGVGESTTDIVFGGHCLIAENGILLAESERFKRTETLLIADVDLDRLQSNRLLTTTFNDGVLYRGLKQEFRKIPFTLAHRKVSNHFIRTIDPHPFVPSQELELRERCEEIFRTQITGLSRRLEQAKPKAVSIGVSGGLDSTLALLVLCKTLDLLDQSHGTIKALTMPGFGTTSRTLINAKKLMAALDVPYREIDIRSMCFEEMKALGHKPFGISLEGLNVDSLTERLREVPPERRHDLTFENTQARMRTSLLMNSAFVVGTGDLSELALGWCTYNADHMSMYNPNVSIPKTLVKFLVKWAAENEFEGEVQQTLLDIVCTEISPELLPTGKDGQIQSTESSIGPYELHDFFLYYFLRFGMSPEKILFLAEHAKFDQPYPKEIIEKWLKVFVIRFFGNQFKRSCLPDGPKVGSVSLSPRGDWRMPSDAHVTLWLSWAEETKR